MRTKRGYVPAHTNGYDTNDDGEVDLYTHQKELMISGNYGKDRSTSLVVTGSSNYQDAGLRGRRRDLPAPQLRRAGPVHAQLEVHLGQPLPSDPYRQRASRGPVVLLPGPAWESD